MILTEEEIFTLTEHNGFFTNLSNVDDVAGEGIPKLDECISIINRHQILKEALYPYQLEKIKSVVISNREHADIVRSIFELIPAILSSIYFISSIG